MVVEEASLESPMYVDEGSPQMVVDSEGYAACDVPAMPKAVTDRDEQLRCLSDAIQEDWVPRAGQNIYFHRQQLHRSLENRVVDLITITSSASTASESFDGNGSGAAMLDEPAPGLQLPGKPSR